MSSETHGSEVFCTNQSQIKTSVEKGFKSIYERYYENRRQMEIIFETWGERCTKLINELLRLNAGVDRIDREHQSRLDALFRRVYAIGSAEKRSECLYIICGKVQEWFLEGPEGSQFFWTVEIDLFEYYDHLRPWINSVAAQEVFIFTHKLGYVYFYSKIGLIQRKERF